MIAIDTNLLVYAYRGDAQAHRKAAAMLDLLAEGGQEILLPIVCLHEFISVVTHPKIYRPASPIPDAWKQIERWRARSDVVIGYERPSYWPYLERLVHDHGIAGSMIHDARVAAIAMDYGVAALWSNDKRLASFHPLRVVNPLA